MVTKEYILINAIERMGEKLYSTNGRNRAVLELFDECVQNLTVSIFETEITSRKEIDDLIDEVILNTTHTLHNPEEELQSVSKINDRINLKQFNQESDRKLLFLTCNKLTSDIINESRKNKADSLVIYERDYLTLIDLIERCLNPDLLFNDTTLKSNEKNIKRLEKAANEIYDGKIYDGYKAYLRIASDECFQFLKVPHGISTIQKYFECNTDSRFISNYFTNILFAITNIPDEDLFKAYEIMNTHNFYMTYASWVTMSVNLFDPFHFVNIRRLLAVIILCCKEVTYKDDIVSFSCKSVGIRGFYSQILQKYGYNTVLPDFWRKDEFYKNIHKIMNVH